MGRPIDKWAVLTYGSEHKDYYEDTEEIEDLGKALEGDLESICLGESRGSRDEDDKRNTTEGDLLVSAYAIRVELEEDRESDKDKENEEL